MRTKGQLRSFLCHYLEVEESMVEIQLFDPELDEHTALRSTAQLTSGVDAVWLVKQGPMSPAGGHKRKIAEFTFTADSLGISVTNDSRNSSLYVSGVKLGGQAKQLGVKCGDIVIGINGMQVDDCLHAVIQSGRVDAFVAHVSLQGRPLTLNMLVVSSEISSRVDGQSARIRGVQQTPMMQQIMMQHAENQRVMLHRMEDMQAQIEAMQSNKQPRLAHMPGDTSRSYTPSYNQGAIKEQQTERLRILQTEHNRREGMRKAGPLSPIQEQATDEAVEHLGTRAEQGRGRTSVLEQLQLEVQELKAANLRLERAELTQQARAATAICSPESKAWFC
jgi:hypothetical protein